MTGPDNNYQPNPQQPQWESGPVAGQYSTGGQYSTAGRYPTGGQYPADGAHRTRGEGPAAAPSTGGGYPGNQFQPGQYPTGNPYSAAPMPPVQAYRPGPASEVGGSTQHDPFSGGMPPGAGRFGADQPRGATVAPSGSAEPRRVNPAKLFGLTIAGLGGLNFVFGFLPEVSAPRTSATLSVFAVGPAYVPILLLIAGLLALAAFLPGSERSRLAVAAVSVGGAAGAIVSLGTPGSFELFANPNQVSSGLGAILLVIFGIVQAVIAVGAYVVGADTQRKPRRGPEQAGPAGVPVSSAALAAGGVGPIDPSLVGVYPPQQPHEVGFPYLGRGVTTRPAGQTGTEQSWSGPMASSGYSQVPSYGGPGQTVTSVIGGGFSPSRPVQPEEPVTGPQVVIGMETVRVDTRKVSEAAPPPTTRDEDGTPSGPADTGSAGDPRREPADGAREPAGAGTSADGASTPAPAGEAGSADDRPTEQDLPHRSS